MRMIPIATLTVLSLMNAASMAQEALRFDRPIFSVEGTALCPRQEHVTTIRRALEGDDRATANRTIAASCKVVGPDVPLTVVARPGLYDPDVEVRVAATAEVDPSVPRGRRWTLKSMVRN